MDVLEPRRHHKRSESYSNQRQPVNFFLGYSSKPLQNDDDDDVIDPNDSNLTNDYYSNVDADDHIHWSSVQDKLGKPHQRGPGFPQRPRMDRMTSSSTMVSTIGYTNLKSRINRAPSSASEISQGSHGSSISTSTLVDINSRGKAEPHIITVPINRRSSASSSTTSTSAIGHSHHSIEDIAGPRPQRSVSRDTIQPTESISSQELPTLASLEKNNLMLNLSELTHQVDFIDENMTSSTSSASVASVTSDRHSAKYSLSSGSTESLPGASALGHPSSSFAKSSTALPVSPPLSPPMFAESAVISGSSILSHHSFQRSDGSLALSAAKSRFFENFAEEEEEERSVAEDDLEIDFDQKTVSRAHSRASSSLSQLSTARSAGLHSVYPGLSASPAPRISTVRNSLFEDVDDNSEDAEFLSRLGSSNFGLGTSAGVLATSRPGTPICMSSPSSDDHCGIKPQAPSDNGLIPINLEPVSPLLLAAAVTESSESLVCLQEKAMAELQLEDDETITDKFHQRPLLADPDKPFIPSSPVFPDIDELFREYYPDLLRNSLDYEHHKSRLLRNRIKLRRLNKSITDYEEERRRKLSLNKLHSHQSSRAHVHGF